ncbi:MAG: 1-acyl-sn-glycerol-3-phosphate acyltransferase, partial [Bacteroidia bacterium]|nr:1-acyl-sn-glycerol-3-phosphate acyltransferase [Bacteroidia bacterium]
MEFYPLYDLFRLPFYTAVGTYYKRIQFRNKAVIFPDRPVIIAMNHPNSFMDPIAFSSQCIRKMFYLARGDSFKKGIGWALEGVGIIPIYRMSDAGRDGVKKNDESFEAVSRHLAKNHSVIIFPEGLCIQERRLRNLKKGCARIVFYSMEELK